MTYKRHRRRRQQGGSTLGKFTRLAKIGMPMAMAAYDAYKGQKQKQQEGFTGSMLMTNPLPDFRKHERRIKKTMSTKKIGVL